MWHKARAWLRALATQSLLPGVLVSCNNGVGFLPGTDTGTLSLRVTDAPADQAVEIVVDFAGVEVKPEDDDPFILDIEPDRPVELLALRAGATVAILPEREVPAGRYEWIRLIVNARPDVQDDSFVQLATGERFPLVIRSGDGAGLRVERPFTVSEGEYVELVADFDLRRSVLAPPGGAGTNWFFVPVVRVVDGRNVGAIAGRVDPLLVDAQCTPFVYVFEGAGVPPDDLDDDPGFGPLTSVPVTTIGPGGLPEYRVSFLEPGDYTVSFTCDGAADDPQTNDFVSFDVTVNATVSANETTIVDLES